MPFALAVICFFSGSQWAAAQRRTPVGTPTGFDDVVFAIAFSPDGSTLAIARGAEEPSQRFGRIELWDTATGTLRHVIKGFDGPVKSVSFSPDGQTLVSASSEYHTTKVQEKARSRDGGVFGELKWWDAQSGELKHQVTLPGDGNSSIDAVYSPDDKQLAVVEAFMQYSYLSMGQPFDFPTTPSLNPTIPRAYIRQSMFYYADMKLLDAKTGEQKFKLNTARAGRAVFSPDGELLALANGNEIKVWNARTGKEEKKLKGFNGTVNPIAFSPDGQLLAVASTKYDSQYSRHSIKTYGNSEVRVFDVHTWKATSKMAHVGAVNCLAFLPGDQVLMGGVLWEKNNAIPAIRLWDLQTGNSVNVARGGDTFVEAVSSLAITRTGDLLAFRSGPGTVKLLDVKTWSVRQTMSAESVGDAIERPVSRFVLSVKRVLAVAFSADSKTLFGETDQGEIKLWDPRTGEVKKQFSDDEDPSLVAVSADGKTFAEVSNAKLRLWEAGASEKRPVSLPAGHLISAIALSSDGQTLAVGGGRGIVLLTQRGEVINTLTSQRSVDHLNFADNHRLLASADENGTVEIWDLTNARIDKTIATGARTTALCFAPNGSMLATGNEARVISLWNLQSGLAQGKLQKHEAAINALAFSSDGRLLASGSDDRTVIIWDTASGKSKRTLKGHDQTVTSVAFSPDGHLLASGSGNASVVLWEVKTGKLSRVLR